VNIKGRELLIKTRQTRKKIHNLKKKMQWIVSPKIQAEWKQLLVSVI